MSTTPALAHITSDNASLPIKADAAGALTALAICTSPTNGQTLAGCVVANEALDAYGVSSRLVETRHLPYAPAGTEKELGFPTELSDLIDAASTAPLLVLGVRTIRSAIAGHSMNTIEMLRSALTGRPVVPIVAAGSTRAVLVADDFRSHLWAHFEARPTKPVLVAPDLPHDELRQRITDAIGEALTMAGLGRTAKP